MAQRFSQGGHLLAFANVACATDAQHVAVVHPVIVGKCALPTLALTNDSPSAEWRGWPRWCRLYTPAWPAGPAARTLPHSPSGNKPIAMSRGASGGASAWAAGAWA
jgi:hypothetical protein